MSDNIFRDNCPAPHHGECNVDLPARTVVSTLEVHGFEVRANLATGKIEAWEPATIIPLDGGPVQDASDWVEVPHNVHALAIWLGY